MGRGDDAVLSLCSSIGLRRAAERPYGVLLVERKSWPMLVHVYRDLRRHGFGPSSARGVLTRTLSTRSDVRFEMPVRHG